MNTSLTTFVLSEPVGREPIPPGVLQYFQTRNRMRAFAVVQQEFEKSGINKAELADRLERGADRISHLLNAPGNWTLDTISDLLFAIAGAELEYRVIFPLRKPSRNQTTPEWLYEEPEPMQITLKVPVASQITYAESLGYQE